MNTTTGKLRLVIDMIIQNSRKQLTAYAQANGGSILGAPDHIRENVKARFAFIMLLESYMHDPLSFPFTVEYDDKFVRIAMYPGFTVSDETKACICNYASMNWDTIMCFDKPDEWNIYLRQL